MVDVSTFERSNGIDVRALIIESLGLLKQRIKLTYCSRTGKGTAAAPQFVELCHGIQ